MLDQLEQLAAAARAELEQLTTGDALDAWNRRTIGRNGEITGMLRRVGELPKEERPAFGQRGREIFEEKFTIQRSASRMIELYHRIASLGRLRANY